MFKFIAYTILLFIAQGCALFRAPVCDCAKQPTPTCNVTDARPISFNQDNVEPKEEEVVVIPSSEAANLVPIDPWDDSLHADPKNKGIVKTFAKVGQPIAAFRGEFGTKYGEEYVGIMNDKIVFSNGGWSSSYRISKLALSADLKKINLGSPQTGDTPKVELKSARAADLLRDGVNELAVIVASTDDPTKRIYRFQIFKTIGQHVAKVFDHPFAVKTAEGARQVARIDFIDGPNGTQIRLTPLSEDGLLDLTHIKIFSWNQWEGMFRVPKKAPTSPRR